MKKFIFSVILLISTKCFAQDYYSLIAKSYIITNNGTNTKVNGVISLIYSKEYTVLYIQGKGTISFHNEQYTRDLQEGRLHENFLSGETNTTLYGHYSIHIYQTKDNNIIQIGSFITGTTFYAEHAQLYSETGKVLRNAYVENWKELMDKEIQRKKMEKLKADSIRTSLALIRIKDSIDVVRMDSVRQIETEKKLDSGENYLAIDRNEEVSLNDSIRKFVKLKKGEVIYFIWVIKIDSKGLIIDAFPKDNYISGHIISSYVPAISKALINQKVKSPFMAKGKTYPSYSNVYVNLNHSESTGAKRFNIKNAIGKVLLPPLINQIK